MPELVHTVDFIRHAHSDMNGSMENAAVPFIGGRQNEVGLDSLGEQQAHQRGVRFAAEGFVPTRVYCSPANRTRLTKILTTFAMGVDTATIIDDRLQELDQGDWTNRPRTLYDDHREEMERLGSDFAPPGGQSMNDVADEAMDFLADLARILDSADTPQRIIVFTHGVKIKCLLGRLLGWSHEQTYQTVIDNVSRTGLARKEGSWLVEFINERVDDRAQRPRQATEQVA